MLAKSRVYFVLSALVLFLLVVPAVQGQTGKNLQDPSILDKPLGIERLPNGNTLITDTGGAFYTATDASVMEVDASGAIVWQYVGDLVFPHSAERLADGTTLISDTSNNRVLIVDAGGSIVWSSDSWGGGTGELSDGSHLLYPNDAEQLDNGHLLITDRNNDRVVEVDDNGQVAWAWTGLNRPHNADRLSDGHTIVSDSENNLIIEVDAQGNEVWRYGGEGLLYWPRDADRLDDGNTLITDTRNDRVIEITPEGTVVWEFKGLSLPYEADRLANGHTLIADNNHKRVIEVDSAGSIVWSFRNFPETYPATVQNGGFEEVDAEGLPAGWYAADLNAERGELMFAVDDTTSHGGQRSGFLSYRGNGRIAWFQIVQVEPGKEYAFSGYVKGTVGQDGIIACQLWFVDGMGGPIGDPITVQAHTASMKDWVHDEKTVTAPANAAAVQVWCNLLSNGRAWFDDVSLAEPGAGGLAIDLGTVLLGAGVVVVVLLVLGALVAVRSGKF
ncbi:MAG: hypothetical protein KKA73_25270 [Chloroflexi bacterium]|nr:hypothetical protein [Chloroflexota bacterium]MBU1751008.1 hypothetical protein [Chloroflexota bacterium]